MSLSLCIDMVVVICYVTSVLILKFDGFILVGLFV